MRRSGKRSGRDAAEQRSIDQNMDHLERMPGDFTYNRLNQNLSKLFPSGIDLESWEDRLATLLEKKPGSSVELISYIFLAFSAGRITSDADLDTEIRLFEDPIGTGPSSELT